MFIGHYGPAAGLARGQMKLWHGALAVQLLDLLWAPLVLAGVEGVRIAPGITASNALDLYHMPWSHSLPMALIWSIAAGLAYALLRRKAGAFGGAVIAVLVFSHWALDFLTHRPDLELWIGGPKVGLGLWENRPLSFGLEIGLFAAGLFIYRSATRANGALGAAIIPVIFGLGATAQAFANWGPPPASAAAAAMSALVAYAAFIALAMIADAARRPNGD